MECPDERKKYGVSGRKGKKLKNYISELILDRYDYIPAANVNVFRELASIKMTVSRFIRTGSFLIRYSNDHTK